MIGQLLIPILQWWYALSGGSALGGRIYRGEVVRPDDDMNFNYQVQLMVNGSMQCGGTLIAPRKGGKIGSL